MPIRRLSASLVVVLAITVFVDNAPIAHGVNAFRVTTMVGTNVSTMQKAMFKFVTSHKRPKPRDMVKVLIEGLDLTSGDQLALYLTDPNDPADATDDNVVEIGDPATTDVLILDSRFKATGQLGSFPNDFTRCKAKYNPKRRRLVMFCKKGTALQIPVDLASGGGAFRFQRNLTVTLYINGVAYNYPAIFDMRLRNKPQGPLTERGKYRNR